jgi:4-hydroxyphenylpyruvate dioxygenase
MCHHYLHTILCTAQDVGTVDSGLNSLVLASNNEAVLLPVNEPTTGTRRKSQVYTLV